MNLNVLHRYLKFARFKLNRRAEHFLAENRLAKQSIEGHKLLRDGALERFIYCEERIETESALVKLNSYMHVRVRFVGHLVGFCLWVFDVLRGQRR